MWHTLSIFWRAAVVWESDLSMFLERRRHYEMGECSRVGEAVGRMNEVKIKRKCAERGLKGALHAISFSSEKKIAQVFVVRPTQDEAFAHRILNGNGRHCHCCGYFPAGTGRKPCEKHTKMVAAFPPEIFVWISRAFRPLPLTISLGILKDPSGGKLCRLTLT